MSNSMKDNPLMHYYASIYALSMAVMLILKAIRGVVFVKVCTGASAPLLTGGFVVRLLPGTSRVYSELGSSSEAGCLLPK